MHVLPCHSSVMCSLHLVQILVYISSECISAFSFSGVVMKLHEKILTHYLSCTSPVDKEGYLNKRVWDDIHHRQCEITFHVQIQSFDFIYLKCPRRKNEMTPTTGGGLSWRQTCSFTRSAQLTDTCWVSLCWKGVLFSTRRPMDILPSPWCLGLDSKPTDLQQ